VAAHGHKTGRDGPNAAAHGHKTGHDLDAGGGILNGSKTLETKIRHGFNLYIFET
jgi:hypothetical protein